MVSPLLLQVAQDASSEGPVENPLLEGGSTPEERQASFLELALCLAAGLPDAALDPLFVVSGTVLLCHAAWPMHLCADGPVIAAGAQAVQGVAASRWTCGWHASSSGALSGGPAGSGQDAGELTCRGTLIMCCCCCYDACLLPLPAGLPAACVGWVFAAAEAGLPCAGLPGGRAARLAQVPPAADAGADVAGICCRAVARQTLQAEVRPAGTGAGDVWQCSLGCSTCLARCSTFMSRCLQGTNVIPAYTRHIFVRGLSACLPACRCLRPIILLLDNTPCPALSGLVDASTGAEKVPGGAALAAAADEDEEEEEGGSKAEERRLLLAQTLVGELVLATKEVGVGFALLGFASPQHVCVCRVIDLAEPPGAVQGVANTVATVITSRQYLLLVLHEASITAATLLLCGHACLSTWPSCAGQQENAHLSLPAAG